MSGGGAWVGEDWGALAFSNEVGGPFSGWTVGRQFSKLVAEAGIPHTRYHDLRHRAASLKAVQGVSPRVAMEILGHAQISTTMNIFTHVVPELGRDAADLMAEALWGES